MQVDSYDVHSYTSPELSAPLAATTGELGIPRPNSVQGGLAGAIADRAADYTGPISSETGRMLWAIQAWYLERGEQTAADEILALHDQSSAAAQ